MYDRFQWNVNLSVCLLYIVLETRIIPFAWNSVRYAGKKEKQAIPEREQRGNTTVNTSNIQGKKSRNDSANAPNKCLGG